MSAPAPEPPPTSILFVCLGNICRSPLAEGVFRHLVRQQGVEDRFEVDSAGTGAWHEGEPPDVRSAAVADAHGIQLEGTARKVTRHDLERFDLIIAMDRDNLRDLKRLTDRSSSPVRLHLLREFDPHRDGDDVPDPYYGGPGGFETMYTLVRRSCEGLLEDLRGNDVP
jgi:protein-tyrosine phosphatase